MDDAQRSWSSCKVCLNDPREGHCSTISFCLVLEQLKYVPITQKKNVDAYDPVNISNNHRVGSWSDRNYQRKYCQFHCHCDKHAHYVHIHLQLAWLDKMKGNCQRISRICFSHWFVPHLTLHVTSLCVPLKLLKCLALFALGCLSQWKLNGHCHLLDRFSSIFAPYYTFYSVILTHRVTV